MAITPSYPPASDQDFIDADQDRIAHLEDCSFTSAETGDVIWNNNLYSFVDGVEAPNTANQSLWRQTQLCYKQGLYKVVDGIYQIRGFDLANITFVETETSHGVIVIDPLTSYECAKAALKFYQDNRPKPVRKIVAMIYTHCHGDHFGGADAIVEAATDAGHTLDKIYAPDGFLDHAVSENVYAGNAMLRRAVYMYGISLTPGPTGQIGTGLGCATSTGKTAIISPTITITKTTPIGEPIIIDGVKVLFQVTPGTEAPSEMNFFFPDFHALCMAENASHTLHNIQTLRGALVRDARVWSQYLDEAITLYAKESVVSFASHHWPTFGKDNIIKYLSDQRDMYAYLHNETLRRLNNGEIGSEIAEDFVLPKTLNDLWSCRGYYGSLSHNVKAVYNRYMGWFDANPAHLWEYPPVETANRYVASLGGIKPTINLGNGYADGSVGGKIDLRFAATLLSHAVFCDDTNEAAKKQAREDLADVFTKLGYGAENATWRNFYLTGAKELIGDIAPALNVISPESFMDLSIQQLTDTWAIRVMGPAAGLLHPFTIDLVIHYAEDVKTRYSGWHMNMSNGALTGYVFPCPGGILVPRAGLTIWLTHQQLVDQVVAAHKHEYPGLGDLRSQGDATLWSKLTHLVQVQDPGFAIVTPEKISKK